jgi:hypothetical protein
MTMEAFMVRECKQANTAMENQVILMREPFPQNDNDLSYELPQRETPAPASPSTQLGDPSLLNQLKKPRA